MEGKRERKRESLWAKSVYIVTVILPHTQGVFEGESRLK